LTGCTVQTPELKDQAWGPVPVPAKHQVAMIIGTNPCPIIVQTETAPFGKALAGYLKRMSGQEFKVVTLTNGVPAKANGPLQCVLAGPVKSLRIGLPGSAVTVEDVYAGPVVEKVELTWDKAQGILTTEISTATVTNDNWVMREIKFTKGK
jgi:hypothetical protein